MNAAQLLVCGTGTRRQMDALNRVLVKVRLDRTQPSGMFRIAPFKVQFLQDGSDMFFHPTGDKRQIHLWVMAQHHLVKKDIYLAIAYHPIPL